MKKVLLINNGYPSENNKHYVSYVKSIKECLIEAGFHVDIIVMSSVFSSKAGKIRCYWAYYFKLIRFKNYDTYDYVYINNFPHSFLPLISHFKKMKKIIIHWHGDDIESNGFLKKIFNKFSYNFVPKKTIHFSPSKYFSTQIGRKLDISADAIFVTPSGGVDTLIFKPFNKIQNEKNIIRIGFSSHLSKAKGIDLIIKFLQNAFSNKFNRDLKVEFHYIKYGAEKEMYSKILRDFPNTFEYPLCKKENMPKFYNNIDLFLFPTKKDSLGSVGIEALACGVPVLATNDFAIKEYVLPGINGELFEKDNYKSFEENLIICINNIEKYNPRETILKEYSKSAVVEKYKQFLG